MSFAFQFLLEIYKFLKDPLSKETSVELPHPMFADEKRDTSKPAEGLESPATSKLPPKIPNEPSTERELSEESTTYCKEQRDRIFNVCKGHLNWVFNTAWKEDRPNFGGNHWATGQPITFSSYLFRATMSPPSLANTPFQIIKAFEFAKCWSDNKGVEHSSEPIDREQDQDGNRQIPANPALREQSANPDHASDAGATDRAEDTRAFRTPRGLDDGETPNSKVSESTVSASKPANGDEKVPDDFNGWEFARSLVESKVEPWINDLALKNKRMWFAFSRSAENGVSRYLLEDHVWIWRALKCLEDFELDTALKPALSLLFRNEHGREISLQDAKKTMLMRFTLEENFWKHRLLATSRTVKESRFLFRSRDTALFYGMKHGFFETEKSTLGPWINAIEIQKFHEYNDDIQWKNTLRFGLAMIMASSSQRQINHKTADEMFLDAAQVLLYSARSNGLFPGEFDQDSREAVMFVEERYRDSYWNSCFELPYILWIYGKQCLDKSPTTRPEVPRKRAGTLGQVTEAIPENIPTSSTKLSQEAAAGVYQNKGGSETHNNTTFGAQKRIRDTKADNYALAVKKTLPFSDFIDHKSVVELPDEWLYGFPDFLDFDPQIESWKDISARIVGLFDLERPDGHSTAHRFVEEGKKILKQTLEDIDDEESCEETFGGNDDWGSLMDSQFSDTSGNKLRGSIRDISKSKKRSKGSSKRHNDDSKLELELMSNQGIWEILRKTRTEREAKKRIIWLPFPDKGTILLCCLGNPDSQYDSLMEFFDRHYSYEKYFFDGTMAVRNTWETELHLPFYQLQDNSAARSQDDTLNRGIGSPGLDGKKIVRAAIGFRFFGDFLDRYWTCHIVEHIPNQSSHAPRIGEAIEQLTSEQETWKQRKALELMLFDAVLSEVLTGLNDILKALNIRVEQSLSSGLSSNDYFNLRNRWQSLKNVLRVLEEELKETLEQIEGWRNRETDRSKEQPRWTKKDEREYRRPINKLLRSNERKIRKLQAYQSDIQSSRTRFRNTEQSVRDDLSFRRAEDIRFFTYVTVVFLPLGFAASIFSMNGTPSTFVLSSMIVTAVTALILTVLALICARNLAGFFSDISRAICRAVTGITSNSILYKYYSDQSRQSMPSSKDGADQGDGASAYRSIQIMARGLWYCWFCVAYITQEVPGRQFAIAYKKWQATNTSAKEKETRSNVPKRPSVVFHAGVWVLQIPLKLGILFAIALTRLICWLVTALKILYLRHKSKLALTMAVIFAPVFVISYVVNLIWLNIYDTAVWSGKILYLNPLA